MVELIKQPNGKYCAMNTFGELIFSNYTEQDIIDYYLERIKKDIENANHYGEIIKNIESYHFYNGKRKINDKELESMGFDKSYKELVKFIQRKPLEQSYVSCDFTTYAKCPNCGGRVQNGIGHTDEKCKCGQLLKW